MGSAERQQAAASVCSRILALDCYRDAQRIAAYVAVTGEMDPLPLLLNAHARGKQLFLPRIPSRHPGVLQFFAWQPDATMQPNRLGIPEPAAGGARSEAQALDLVLVPLLGFDTHGWRLGMGGGYYDRTFAFLKTGTRHPFLMGIGYDFQRLDGLVPEPWDVPLDAVVTEGNSYLFRQAARNA